MSQDNSDNNSANSKNTPAKAPRKRLGAKQAAEVRQYHHFTATRRNKFLRALEKTGNINSAAAHAGVSRPTVYALMKRNERFAERVQMAKDKACGALEEEAVRRARDGVVKHKYYKGELIRDKDGKPVEEREYSDTLLAKLLEAAAPELYGKKSSVNVKQDITVTTQDSAKDKLAKLLGFDEAIDAEFKEVDEDEDNEQE